MKVKKIKLKISLFLAMMLIFCLAGSSFIYASDTQSGTGSTGITGFINNIIDAVESFVGNIKSLFVNNDTAPIEENGESDNGEDPEDAGSGEVEDTDNGHNFGEEISLIAQVLRTEEATVGQLVDKATSIHLEVLAEVCGKVPEAAKSAISGAMENSMNGNGASQDALNKGDDSDKGKGRDNASDRGRQMRYNPSNR
jgi:hypothetical protein